ncbi:RF-1 domain-containing protein [Amanita rubescens]|nr:RF-1 domain-containing protein [Amanita rubescens]
MSIAPSLRASARSAYRNLCRAASSTFQGNLHLDMYFISNAYAGDDVILKAFRQKIRQDALAARSITDSTLYQQQGQLAREIADVLRKNIVQATRVAEDTQSELETWKLRIRPETELGSNDTIKCPTTGDTQSSRSVKKRESVTYGSPIASNSPDTSNAPIYYSALKKAHKNRKLPVLHEEDIEESFVRGSGPGGQSINKTENNVQLLHKPTGFRVSCQETRSLSTNRKLARRLLLEKLDQLENPGLTKGDLGRAKQRERERRRRKKAKKKQKKED